MLKRPDPEELDEPPPRDRNLKADFIIFLVVAAFIAGCVWLLLLFRQATKVQDCVLAGHHNCVPVDVDE